MQKDKEIVNLIEEIKKINEHNKKGFIEISEEIKIGLVNYFQDILDFSLSGKLPIFSPQLLQIMALLSRQKMLELTLEFLIENKKRVESN